MQCPYVSKFNRYFNQVMSDFGPHQSVQLFYSCPHCHLSIPRALVETESFLVSILGTPACGKSYYLAALTRRAAVCVTNDSGSMHLAVALGRPVVSVFGPTDPLWIGPYGRPRAVVRRDMECAPCYRRRLRDCPNGHACMREVSAADVIERLEETLARATPLAA